LMVPQDAAVPAPSPYGRLWCPCAIMLVQSERLHAGHTQDRIG